MRLVHALVLVLLAPAHASVEDQKRKICQVCKDITEDEATAECFMLIADCCQYDPDDVDPAESSRVRAILKQWPFCIGHTARQHSEMSGGSRIRVINWKARHCNPAGGLVHGARDPELSELKDPPARAQDSREL